MTDRIKKIFKAILLISMTTSIMPCAIAQQVVPAPAPVPVAAKPPAVKPQPDFNQWLKTNGYAEEVTTTTTTTTTRPEPTGQELYYVQSLNNRAARPVPAIPSPTFEEERRALLDSAPKSKFPPDEDSTVAFNALLKQNMPLSPRQIVELHQQVDVAQRAAAIPANIPPKPVSSTIMVNLAPGTTPPAVRLAQGYVSSLVFVDSTGAPWPIAAFDIGNPKAVNIQWDGKSNILIIQAVSPYTDGDIVVRLVGLPTPVTLELVSGQRVVDYRADIHVSGIGPNTKDLPMGTILPASANQLLLGVLDGIAPAGSRILVVNGADADAFLLGEKMYLRTRLTVLSPGWMGKMVSPDGMQAYELPKTSSVLVSRFGEPAELKIEGF
jgi:intracellular multiplication protein IcmK